MFAFQIFENVGMTMGIMPITGIPLPFMSYGGSAMIATFACIGLVLNVSHAPLRLNPRRPAQAALPGGSGSMASQTCQTCGRGSNRSWPGSRSPLATSGWSGAASRRSIGPSQAAWLLVYPDTYEIGLPNQGLQILYEILNERDDAVAERAYAPWIDMEGAMRADAACRCSRSTPTAPPATSTSSPSTSRPSSSTRTCSNCLDLAGVPGAGRGPRARAPDRASPAGTARSTPSRWPTSSTRS